MTDPNDPNVIFIVCHIEPRAPIMDLRFMGLLYKPSLSPEQLGYYPWDDEDPDDPDEDPDGETS